MIFILLGSLFGLILGISGAGGSIVGIPMIVHTMGYSVKEATVVVLPLVAAGAILTWIPQWRQTQWPVIRRVTLPLIGASWGAGYIKSYIPVDLISILLVTVALWGLWRTWQKQRCLASAQKNKRLKWIWIGGISGLMTTLTGLGGGLFLVPILKKSGAMTMSEAVATSLVIIGISCGIAMVSLWHANQFHLLPLPRLINLGVGMSITSYGFYIWMQKTALETQEGIQKWVYSLVLIASVVGLLI